MAISEMDYLNAGAGNWLDTQQIIAPVLLSMVSDRAYAVGEQFIVDSVLYKITQAVSAAGVDLVVGTNCELVDTVTEQIKQMEEYQSLTLTPQDNSVRYTSQDAYRIGNKVYIAGQCTVDTAISSWSYYYATNLPIPKSGTVPKGYFSQMDTTDMSNSRFGIMSRVDSNGNLRQDWAGNVAAGRILSFYIMYVTD